MKEASSTFRSRLPTLLLALTLSQLAVTMACMVIWARNIGLAEDWLMVPVMTGHEENIPSWLWSQNNEHRLPVQRLLYAILLGLTGDFRSGMVFSQLLLSGSAILMIRVAYLIRSRALHWSDALFPLALLHLGHWENLLWGWQIQFVWSVFLSLLLLALVVGTPATPDWKGVAGRIVLFLLLPISGANGVVFTAAMMPWLVLQAAMLRASDDAAQRRAGAVLLLGGLASVAVIYLYFHGYRSPPWSPPIASTQQMLATTARYFGLGLGSWTRPISVFAGPLVLAFCGLGGLLALRAALDRRARDRSRAFGLALFIGAGVALGLAISLARGSLPDRLPDRYALFALLPVIASTFAWQLYARPRFSGWLRGGLAVFLLLTLPLNAYVGFKWRNWYVQGMEAVERDIAGGIPIEILAARHHGFLMHWSEDALREGMSMLHDAKTGPFAQAAP